MFSYCHAPFQYSNQATKNMLSEPDQPFLVLLRCLKGVYTILVSAADGSVSRLALRVFPTTIPYLHLGPTVSVP